MMTKTDNTIISVDFSVRPSYPVWVKKVVHPRLELTGPTEYNVGTVERWIHEGQKNNGEIEGQIIYSFLKRKKMLGSCLGLRDLEKIQRKGVAFAHKYFQESLCFGWRSVVLDRSGYLHAPYLYENGYDVLVNWRWLGLSWSGYYTALLFGNSAH